MTVMSNDRKYFIPLIQPRSRRVSLEKEDILLFMPFIPKTSEPAVKV